MHAASGRGQGLWDFIPSSNYVFAITWKQRESIVLGSNSFQQLKYTPYFVQGSSWAIAAASEVPNKASATMSMPHDCLQL